VALALGLGLPFLLGDAQYVIDQYSAWWARVLGDDRTAYPLANSYRDLQMLLRVWGWPLSLASYRLLELALAGLAAAGVAVVGWNGDRGQAVWSCGALATCWMTVAGPATESSTYVLAAPLLAACILESQHGPVSARFTAWASWILFTIGALAAWWPRPVADAITGTGIQPLAGVVLTWSVGVLIVRGPRWRAVLRSGTQFLGQAEIRNPRAA
jgi:hypothetical protein